MCPDALGRLLRIRQYVLCFCPRGEQPLTDTAAKERLMKEDTRNCGATFYDKDLRMVCGNSTSQLGHCHDNRLAEDGSFTVRKVHYGLGQRQVRIHPRSAHSGPQRDFSYLPQRDVSYRPQRRSFSQLLANPVLFQLPHEMPFKRIAEESINIKALMPQ